MSSHTIHNEISKHSIRPWHDYLAVGGRDLYAAAVCRLQQIVDKGGFYPRGSIPNLCTRRMMILCHYFWPMVWRYTNNLHGKAPGLLKSLRVIPERPWDGHHHGILPQGPPKCQWYECNSQMVIDRLSKKIARFEGNE